MRVWEVFRRESKGEHAVHCGNVHAPDAEMAKQFAQIQHARRKPAHALWVVPKDEIHVVDEEDTTFGGATNKSYRWATTFNVDASFAQEIEDSQREQERAEEKKSDSE